MTKITTFKNIEQVKTRSRSKHGLYRCRVMINGIRYEQYETNLSRAKNWVNAMKNNKGLITKLQELN